jgi:hypothetical protein
LDVAEQITARLESRPPSVSSLLLPTVADGVEGLRFIQAALRSSEANGDWTSF